MTKLPSTRRDLLKWTSVGIIGRDAAKAKQTNDIATVSESLSYGDVVFDSLSTNSQFDENLNGYHTAYTFDGSSGETISIEMRPDTDQGVEDEDHAVSILLFDPEGEEVASEAPYTFGYGATGIDRLELESDGTYTIVATTAPPYPAFPLYSSQEDSYYDTFSYELRLHKMLGESTAEMDYNSTVEGQLTPSDKYQDPNSDLHGFYDHYVFNGVRGDIISIEMRPIVENWTTSADHAVSVLLFDPDGNRVTTEAPFTFGYGATGIDRYELEADGEYTIVATTAPSTPTIEPYLGPEDNYLDTFDYELRLHEELGKPEETLENNSVIKNSLTIEDKYQDPNSDLHGFYEHYLFEGERGDVVSIEMRPDTEFGVTDEDHAVSILLFDPDGNEVTTEAPFTFGYGATGIDRYKLEADGEYTIVATTAPSTPTIEPYLGPEDNYLDTFDYELRFYKGLGEPDGILQYGAAVDAELASSDNYQDPNSNLHGYYDHYEFEGQEGERIYLSMVPQTFPDQGEHAVEIQLFDPNKEQVKQEQPYDIGYGPTSIDSYQLPESGQYSVVATTAGSVTTIAPYSSPEDTYLDTFSYTIDLNRISDHITQTIDFGDRFTDLCTADDPYVDELVGYHKRYSFEGDESQLVSAEMRVNLPDEQAAHLRLYGPDGTLIESAESEAGAIQLDRVSLNTSGAHTLVATTATEFTASVYDSSVEARTATPQFELRLYDFVGERELLTDGDTIQSRIEPVDNFQEPFVGYYDAYVTTAVEGDSLSIEMNIDQAEDNAAQLILLGPNGSEIADTNEPSGSTELTTTVEETGEYTFIATSEREFTADVYDTTEEAENASFQYQLVFEGPQNAPPLIDEIRTEPSQAAIGETVELIVEASDPNDGSLGYQWEQVIGSFPDPEVNIVDSEAATASFTAPTVEAETDLTFEVTVSDNDGGVVSEQTTMLVDPDKTAKLSAAFTVSPSTPVIDNKVTFDASESTAPSSELVTYEWKITGPETVTRDGVTIDYTFEEIGMYSVVLTVTDDTGQTASVTKELEIVDERTSGPGDVTGTGNPAQDPDGDGLYEDIDGSGEVDIFDVQALYNNLDSINNAGNGRYFQFAAGEPVDQDVSVFDVQALYTEINSSE
ncbi:PKD domain-containing protein [Halorubrum sp. Atlit-28R]|uniref:PKD domain-containing protein n=1 Tax=Halorubrum sp. Atlit-28R TaxID=2282129 RepID=UPI0011C3BA71|nr:PKD domain-containing protein [Halorubrum sp. Atlit-28R]